MVPGKATNDGKGAPTGGMAMTSTSPPPLSDQQTAQLTAGISSATTQKTFNITGEISTLFQIKSQ